MKRLVPRNAARFGAILRGSMALPLMLPLEVGAGVANGGPLAAFQRPAAIQPAVSTRTVNVPANVMWVPSGIKVKPGDKLTIDAGGLWSNAGPPAQGPAGFGTYRYPGTIMPTAGLASLIGKIGASVVEIGSGRWIIAESEGELFLSINDIPGTFADNQGAMRARIVVEPFVPPQPSPAPASLLPKEESDWRVTESTDGRPTRAAVAKLERGSGERSSTEMELIAYSIGRTVYLRDGVSGDLVAKGYSTDSDVEREPVIAKLSDGEWHVFVASSDGHVYRFDAESSRQNPGLPLQVSQVRDMRRLSSGSCVDKDRLSAAPAIQLAAKSNDSYTLGKDIVIVGTSHGCGSTTTNRLYALNAADISSPPVWVFNAGGEYEIDRWSGCTVDYERNAALCSTRQPDGSATNTLWSINTITGMASWAANASSVPARPALGSATGLVPARVYVGDGLARLHSFDAGTGAKQWSLPLATRAGVQTSGELWIGDGPHAGTIIAVTSEGTVKSIDASGVPGVATDVRWTYTIAGTRRAGSGAHGVSSAGKVYVAIDDGTIHQIDLNDGSAGSSDFSIVAGDAACSASVVSPTVYVRDAAPRLVASAQCGSTVTTKLFSIPFRSAPQR